mgnify:CR=1 FL=1|tara:strand:- start:322 stop:759 length:438 start_codon:yes stop_codon:yes gene_type:complete
MRIGFICIIACVVCVIVFSVAYPLNLRCTDDLRLLLSDEQSLVLDEIINERAQIAFEGLVIGLILALLLVLIFRSCMIATIVLFLSQGLYYHAKPKSKWLLNHLDSKEQVSLWLKVYKSMQKTGVSTVFLVTFAFWAISTFFKET